ncbi:hypothetical protein A2Z22_05125 [Candidatus Woesebacteria bacterium RBG_16_34_12]|uniref:Aminoglycoside phosphotransferase domain-containing protein n=1 Tax=Candidatus Woesebacteria bacterium RBG_16_34_12 TaxID=1802480 RepID=A0A1F7X8M5_9BACT|nr:MAG: hypothetical protein A2Z22_05125 [Candidatus Woesebacteria bacterium RBG_16_34_12]
MIKTKQTEQFEFFSKNDNGLLTFPKAIKSKSVNEKLIINILENSFFSKNHKNTSFVSTYLGGGFHSEVTGGEFQKIVFEDKTNKKLLSVVLKHSPSFGNEQKKLFKLLNSLGFVELVKILRKYPSNQVNRRELMFYRYLADEVCIKVPSFYFGAINPRTEETWLVLEDLLNWSKIKPGDKRWTSFRLKMVLMKMAKFHSVFWDKSLNLNQFDWIGRWWADRENDYMSKDVALFGLWACRRIYPDILTLNLYKKLSEVISHRELIGNIFLQQKQTLIHWDFNPNNILFNKLNTNEGNLALLDWQVVSIGIPHLDVAQLIVANMGIENEDDVVDLVKNYIFFLKKYIGETIDSKQFMKIFDLAILDHFFRVCAPVLINSNSESLAEWNNCLGWIRGRSLFWL